MSKAEPVSSIDAQQAIGIAPDRLPRHLAIIMDGNGRWALQRHLPRTAGHAAGAETVRVIVTECGRLGVEVLTLYSFSAENWRRPRKEVLALMGLLVQYLGQELDELLDNNVRLRTIGRREGMPEEALSAIDATVKATEHCTGLTLVLALNYGSRNEIVDAVRAIADDVQAGRLDPQAIDETTIDEHLYTAGLPDPDLLIRTAGEMRISNYLLWQISYAELHVTPTYWPDFREPHLHEAIRDYASRNRRFGALDESNSNKAESGKGQSWNEKSDV